MAESKRHDWGLIVAGALLVLLAIFITAFPRAYVGDDHGDTGRWVSRERHPRPCGLCAPEGEPVHLAFALDGRVCGPRHHHRHHAAAAPDRLRGRRVVACGHLCRGVRRHRGHRCGSSCASSACRCGAGWCSRVSWTSCAAWCSSSTLRCSLFSWRYLSLCAAFPLSCTGGALTACSCSVALAGGRIAKRYQAPACPGPCS